ncbi:MAG: Holliday junction resolvase RuvX [Acidobacteria bacterium]|nr:Holliday junction resolvase RuvX [Acidobacteriota bacterium]
MTNRGRMLAVDYGEKNVGLACSDELGLTVSPLPSLPNRGKHDFLRRIAAAVSELGAREVVLGMPLRMDGSSGDAVDRMDGILRSLRRAVPIPVSGVDERLSTVEALEIWRAMTPRQQKRYRTVDSLAAALILERHLEGS